jgi:formiminotetrahydrofolate cyclodeaminase
MVAGLTEGKKKYQAVEERVREIHGQLNEVRTALHRLAQEDADAYNRVMVALKLPKETQDQKSARAETLEKAMRLATEVPLRTARFASKALDLLALLAEIGNQNALSDAAAGAQLAYAALKAAQYNVLINVAELRDRSFAETCRHAADGLCRQGLQVLRRVDAMLTHPR